MILEIDFVPEEPSYSVSEIQSGEIFRFIYDDPKCIAIYYMRTSEGFVNLKTGKTFVLDIAGGNRVFRKIDACLIITEGR